MSVEISPDTPLPPSGSHGRVVVFGMLAFGVLMVGGLWFYWEFYTRPFRTLQSAIAERYPGSSPRVIGGRHKSHKEGSAKTLRIVVRVPSGEFNPETDLDRSEQHARELLRMTSEQHDLRDYEILEVHLFQRVPEQETLHWSVSRDMDEWARILGLE